MQCYDPDAYYQEQEYSLHRILCRPYRGNYQSLSAIEPRFRGSPTRSNVSNLSFRYVQPYITSNCISYGKSTVGRNQENIIHWQDEAFATRTTNLKKVRCVAVTEKLPFDIVHNNRCIIMFSSSATTAPAPIPLTQTSSRGSKCPQRDGAPRCAPMTPVTLIHLAI
jgi:hypothetical protein